MRILLVRHAESANNDAHASLIAELGADHPELRERSEAARVADPDLTARGRRQAELVAAALAERTAGERLLLVSSPMRRALLTAAPIAQRLGLAREHFWCHGELYEVGGCYVGTKTSAGATPDEIEGEFAVTCTHLAGTGWFAGQALPEHPIDAGRRVERMTSWLETTLHTRRESYDTAILVLHGDLLTRWLRRWLRISWRQGLAFVHGNTGITELRWHPLHGSLLVGLNDLGHLPDELRSGSRITDVWWRYANPELVIDRHPGCVEVDDGLWREVRALRERLLLSREGRSLESYRASDERSVHFLARVRGELAGTAQYDPHNGRLRQVVVAPEFRGARVGRALIEAAREEAARDGRSELTVHAWQESTEFYRRVGFRPSGEPVEDAVPWQPLSIPTRA
ncbi:MAG TPA: GNAT family N-acetyltransferase [Thermoanaerobaculia bacterium]|nr:GNAT family N-acetyltransferase [Thermoanaerobaculia bacterium]